MSEMKTPLENIALSKKFKDQTVLDQISFSIQEGEIFGLIGLNGVGKTTLIKIMLDLLVADSGLVKFFGAAATDPSSRANICYLPEKFQPSTFLKGEEFLQLAIAHFHKKIDNTEVETLANAIGLEYSVLTQKINKYSKGMAQKLGLMSVFLSDAPLLILDEPMSGLDPVARIKLKRILLSYQQKNQTIFFSSHILSDIDEICQRIAVIDKGKILFIGKPSELKLQYNQISLELAFLAALDAAVV